MPMLKERSGRRAGRGDAGSWEWVVTLSDSGSDSINSDLTLDPLGPPRRAARSEALPSVLSLSCCTESLSYCVKAGGSLSPLRLQLFIISMFILGPPVCTYVLLRNLFVF